MGNETIKDKLTKVANLLADLAEAVAEITEPTSQPVEETEAPAKKPPSLEEVRTVLADISRSGKTAEMKALLGQFGAVKLSDVSEKDYAALLKAAKEVTNA